MSFSGLSLRDLEYIDAVAQHRHFGRAAADCGVSQPALSAQIKKVEAIVGAALFERSPRRVLVTGKGEEVLVRARNILREARALLDVTRGETSRLAGPFRLGALPTLGPYLLPYLIRPLRERFPDMHLVLSEDKSDNLVHALREGAIDAALLCQQGNDAGLAFRTLFFEPFSFIHAPGQRVKWPVDETEQTMILMEEGHCLRDQVRDACGLGQPALARKATSLEMMRHMVAAGEGLSLAPALAAQALERGDGLTQTTPVSNPEIGRDVILASRRSDPRDRCIAEVSHMIQSIARRVLSCRTAAAA